MQLLMAASARLLDVLECCPLKVLLRGDEMSPSPALVAAHVHAAAELCAMVRRCEVCPRPEPRSLL